MTQPPPGTRVLITGLGAVCFLGSGVDALWAGLRAARSEPRKVDDPYAHYPIVLGYPVSDVDVSGQPAELAGQPLGTASRLAVDAAGQAMADAGLSAPPAGRTAVVIGTAMGDHRLRERWRVAQDRQPCPPSTDYLVASAVAARAGVRGAVSTVANACAASGYAVAIGADLIRSGEADVVLAGGAETHSRVALANFNRMGALDPVRCRPFDGSRRGTLFGEAGAMVVLESARHAARRTVPRVYGEVAGSGWSCDAHHPTAPEPSGRQIRTAIRRALAGGGVPASRVGCVIPHGTGTEQNDAVEAAALAAVFGAQPPPMYSLKAMVGHTAGAAGALAVVTAALIMRHATVPGNPALDRVDPLCPVTLATEPVATDPEADHVLVNAYAFGGNNVSVLLRAVRP
jgi:3-oxoacyl-(acyl-carrier-protein) synthase